MSTQLTGRIAEHIAAASFDRLPPATVRATKRALLDAVGVMLGASGISEDVEPFIEAARRGATSPQAAVLGRGFRTSAELAALANGAMAHALDFEDTFDRAPGHPNAALIPAALAVAEARGGVSGRELITAVALGCDLSCRIALSLRAPMEAGGWYPPPILGSIGAAAAAARLLGLSPRQVADTLSLILCQVSCPGEIKHDEATVIRAVREAFPASAAVRSAQLAQLGVRGFERPLEGEAGFFRLYVDGEYDPGDVLDGLGEHYWIEELSFKPWPSCRGTHPYIEAAENMLRRHGVAASRITRIVVGGGEVQRMLFFPFERKRAPATAIDAKFSIPFTVALALAERGVTLDSFDDASRNDPEVLRLAGLAEYRELPGWGRERAASGLLELHLSGGQVLSEQVDDPLGSPARPMSERQLRAKFAQCAARARCPLSSGQSDEAADQIESLEHIDDIAALAVLAA